MKACEAEFHWSIRYDVQCRARYLWRIPTWRLEIVHPDPVGLTIAAEDAYDAAGGDS